MTGVAESAFAFPNCLLPVLRLAQSRRVRASICALAAATAVSTSAGPALAEGNVNMRGAAVFSANCAGCHAGGGNVIAYARRRTLFKNDLMRFGADTPEKINALVRDGRGAMPKYGQTLSETELEDVSDFVFQMSENNWQ